MNNTAKIFALFISLALVGLASSQEPTNQTGGSHALLLDINGGIGPATRDYIVSGLKQAAEDNVGLVIIRIDTPGGLDASTRDIVKAILNSPVPVATYVAPEGARAASAGTYILLASHIAAMSPATNVGAATPVSIIGGQSPSQEDKPNAETQSAGNEDGQAEETSQPGDTTDDEGDATEAANPAPAGDASMRKALNDSVAYIRGLAERHGRNADWAERAVRDAESITSEQALELNVIDLIVKDYDSLLTEIDGKDIELADRKVTLKTSGLEVVEQEPDWRNELLAVITDPTIAYLLLIIGFYGLVLEGYHPGAFLPGIVGAISLLLALYALQMLPVNYAGLALIVLGIIFIIAETLAPSFGVLGIGGIIALVIGSIILMDTDVPGFQVSRALIGGIALASSAVLLGIIAMAVRARNRPVVAGREQLIGAHGTANEAFDSSGTVHVSGELWTADTESPLEPGQAVEVIGMEGLTLHVRPLDSPVR